MKSGSQTRTNKLSAPTACAHSTHLTRICSSEELLVSAKNRWPVPPPGLWASSQPRLWRDLVDEHQRDLLLEEEHVLRW